MKNLPILSIYYSRECRTDFFMTEKRNFNLKLFVLNLMSLLRLQLVNSHEMPKKVEFCIFLDKKNSSKNVVYKINRKLWGFFLKVFSNRLNKCFVLWINEPEFYYLQNFVDWNFLIFDYDKSFKLKGYPFYDTIYSKNLLFFYKREKKEGKIDVKFIKKISGSYQSVVWKYINTNEK